MAYVITLGLSKKYFCFGISSMFQHVFVYELHFLCNKFLKVV